MTHKSPKTYLHFSLKGSRANLGLKRPKTQNFLAFQCDMTYPSEVREVFILKNKKTFGKCYCSRIGHREMTRVVAIISAPVIGHAKRDVTITVTLQLATIPSLLAVSFSNCRFFVSLSHSMYSQNRIDSSVLILEHKETCTQWKTHF